MAPTESTILSNFLFPAAPLPTTITLQAFTTLFPRSLQESQDIPSLYRELQHQRSVCTDEVRQNVTSEARRGEKQKRDVFVSRKNAEEVRGDGGEKDRVDIELSNPAISKARVKPHTLQSIQLALDQANTSVEDDISRLEGEAASTLEKIKTIVGDLSDLRYGKLNGAGNGDNLRQEVVDTLRRLEKLVGSERVERLDASLVNPHDSAVDY